MYNQLVLSLASCFTLEAAAVDSSSPGAEFSDIGVPESSYTIIHEELVPSLLERVFHRSIYTASPSIIVCEDGSYLLTCNIFGSGSGADKSGTTFVYRSRDRGQTWQRENILSDMKRGSLFRLGGTLYLWGFSAAPGDIVIRSSLNHGRTWSEARDETSGLLRKGTFGGTPCNPAVFEGRIWIPLGKRVMSAAVDSDLMRADSWTLGQPADTRIGPLGEGILITEAQVVAAPHTGVVLLPKVQHEDPHTVHLRPRPDDPALMYPVLESDWIPFPGGEKKFAAAYDERSGRFYALSNPIFPPYQNSGVPYQLIRNVGALMVSEDLREWTITRIFLHSPNVTYEAFQYFNFDFDGNDLIVASRTAIQLGARKPPRGHDSNLITFHRIPDFRSIPAAPLKP